MPLFKKKKTPKEEFKEFYEEFREKYIPEEYNQLNFLDYFTDEEINVFLEISNRSDGKTTTTFMFFLYATRFFKEIRLAFIVRHFELNISIREAIMNVMIDFPELFDSDKLFFQSSVDYMRVFYDNEEIALIYDLNNALDLKNYSMKIKHFPVLIFDEFLTMTKYYQDNEAFKLDLIYSSVDKIHDRELIKQPKIILLANPINFESEILSSLDIFEVLEQMEINSFQIYGNIFVEMLRNDKVNEVKTSLFPNLNKENVTGEFNFNRYNLVSQKKYNYEKEKNISFQIKIDDFYTIEFVDSSIPLLRVISVTENEEFCLNKKDETKNRKFLNNEKFYRESIKRKFHKDLFKFANNFSKNYILENENLITLNYFKILKMVDKKKNEEIEEVIDELRKEDLRLSILSKFGGYE